MAKTEKELAFLRGIYVEPEFTSKFTELFNEGVVVDGFSTITYLNAGAGGHSIEMGDKLGQEVELFPVCEDADLREIARQKAETVQSDIDFSTELPKARSELVVADASLLPPGSVAEFVWEAAQNTAAKLVFYLPTSGSFGEVFSYLWEVLLELGLEDRGNEVEELITGLMTVGQAEDTAISMRLTKVKSLTKSEFLEYESGAAFLESPLMQYFLLPAWLDFLSEEEQEKVKNGLAAKIDEDRGDMTFRIALKATVVWGERTDA